jgi:hypothetical protein
MKTQRYVFSLLALVLACFAGFALHPGGPAKAASEDPISVLCTSCSVGPTFYGPLYVVIRDETTGQVWAYPHYPNNSLAIEPGAAPILIGTLAPGQPIK